jgi:hypothetical protein
MAVLNKLDYAGTIVTYDRYFSLFARFSKKILAFLQQIV